MNRRNFDSVNYKSSRRVPEKARILLDFGILLKEEGGLVKHEPSKMNRCHQLSIESGFYLQHVKIFKPTYVTRKTVLLNYVTGVYPNSIHLVIDRTMFLPYNLKKNT